MFKGTFVNILLTGSWAFLPRSIAMLRYYPPEKGGKGGRITFSP